MPGPSFAVYGRFVPNLLLCAALLLLNGCVSGTAPQVAVFVSGQAQVRVGGSVQLQAAVLNEVNTKVTWQVNGVTGGSSIYGTISNSGLYVAPVMLPSPSIVTITATSEGLPEITGTQMEQVLNPVPVMSSATAIVTGTSPAAMLEVKGSDFVAGARIQVSGVPVATNVVSSTDLQASTVPSSGATSLSLSVVNPDPGSAVTVSVSVPIEIKQASPQAASRFLDQASFGPTLGDIQHVESIGLPAYLLEQFEAAPTLMVDLSAPTPPSCIAVTINPCLASQWWQAALTGPDQLRQRVAFALSEIFVISTNSVNPMAVVPFQNLLLKDAFGNFSTVLRDVTLSTGMGAYLNLLDSATPGAGQIANENFAREGMQLFTIGLYELNQDGTPVLDGSGNMIPTYTQAQVQAFARAYTGWTYATASGDSPAKWPEPAPNYDHPLVSFEGKHDRNAKTLLNGTTLPAGQSAEEDLTGALANIFAQDNVGPFVCRQLIQHLVSSDPSPAYVGRISAVFADNGSGVRGDLRAVLSAILLDAEARAGDLAASAPGGHLREPVLYLANLMRGLNYRNVDVNGFYGSLSAYSGTLSQSPYSSGSVFNFFPPDYQLPDSSVTSPEFDLENTASVMLRLSLANELVSDGIIGFKVDLSATSPLGLLAANPDDLVNELGLLFMHGKMPADMRTQVVNHITSLSNPAERVRVAAYLVLTSSLYKVEH